MNFGKIKLAALFVLVSVCTTSAAENKNTLSNSFPPPPPMSEWGFVTDLQKREPVKAHWSRNAKKGELDLREGVNIIDEYAMGKNLQTALEDLNLFFGEIGLSVKGKVPLKITRAKVLGKESYRLNVSPDKIELSAADDEGIRRGIYYLENRILSQEGAYLPYGKIERKPWLKNRISRCFFSPIKRPPFNRDELLDGIKYYPDEYLNRLAHEGINGLWFPVAFRELAETSFTKRHPQAKQRLDKMRQMAKQCARYGIKLWIFCIEPKALDPNDPLLKNNPEFKGAPTYANKFCFCPSSKEAQQYLRESLRDIFTQIPTLGGVINISHGERTSTCLSSLLPTKYGEINCPRCSKIPKWKILENSLSAMIAGIRDVNPDAELISWLYQPQPDAERASWVYELAEHVPEGVILQYNFESGALLKQLGRWRSGGDYWLSYCGPAPAFDRIAAHAKKSKTPLSAKIQVGCSHEVATVPFVPMPNLLYKKYTQMEKLGCSSVVQCWYFGNYPGIMNEAAGELAFEKFADWEDAFLKRLAKPKWGESADKIVRLWGIFSNAYANYPISNQMQYYGPMHAGIVWPLHFDIAMRPLAPTWMPNFPPSGDTIGEALENHTLEEALRLSQKMCGELKKAEPLLDELDKVFAGNIERKRDLGLMRALKIQFESAQDIFEFYWQRREFFYQSRLEKNATAALDCLKKMEAIVRRQSEASAQMAELCKADSRLGFHPESQAHSYSVERLKWRQEQLAQTLKKISEAEELIKSGKEVPLGDFEKSAAQCKVGECNGDDLTKWKLESVPNKGLLLTIECNGAYRQDHMCVSIFDKCATHFPLTIWLDYNQGSDFNGLSEIKVEKNADGSWKASVFLSDTIWNRNDRERPEWLYIRRDAYNSKIGKANLNLQWPDRKDRPRSRLNLGEIEGDFFGRIIYQNK